MSGFPSLIVFDLDFTLWDCGGSWVDCAAWPFQKRGDRILGADGAELRLYQDVPEILDKLEEQGCTLALASRTSAPSRARWLLEALDIHHRFPFQEIYPDSKVTHFRKLRQQSGIDYSDMLFFDDEHRNIEEVGALGVTSIPVRSGVHHSLVDSGLERWRSL